MKHGCSFDVAFLCVCWLQSFAREENEWTIILLEVQERNVNKLVARFSRVMWKEGRSLVFSSLFFFLRFLDWKSKALHKN